MEDKNLFDSLIEIEDTKLSEEREVEFENLEFDPKILKKNPLYPKCVEFWRFWIEKHQEEYKNISRGLPQFSNIMDNDNSFSKKELE